MIAKTATPALWLGSTNLLVWGGYPINSALRVSPRWLNSLLCDALTRSHTSYYGNVTVCTYVVCTDQTILDFLGSTAYCTVLQPPMSGFRLLNRVCYRVGLFSNCRGGSAVVHGAVYGRRSVINQGRKAERNLRSSRVWASVGNIQKIPTFQGNVCEITRVF